LVATSSDVGYAGKNFVSGEEKMKSLFSRFVNDQAGATAIEYGLIAALISVVCITVLTTVGSNLNTKFTSVSSALN
jgi:pilus assembly protein Flp/PilA